jgi:hypothetical protein
MAIKLILSYTSQPLVNDSFGFAFFLNGVAIPIGGFLGVNLNYQSGANIPPSVIGIEPTLTQTIDNTLFFLQSSYPHPNITYTRIDDTIEKVLLLQNL